MANSYGMPGAMSVFISISQVRKPRPRGRQWQSWDANPGSVTQDAPKPGPFFFPLPLWRKEAGESTQRPQLPG